MGNAYRNVPDKAYFDRKFEDLQNVLTMYIGQRADHIEQLLKEANIRKMISAPTIDPLQPDNQDNQITKANECKGWKMEMRRRIGELLKSYPVQGKTTNNILGEIYRRMIRQYGQCLDQDKKEYKNGSEERVNTLEVISAREDLRSLFESILCTLEEENRVRIEKKKATEAAALSRTRQEIIRPLIEARNDNSIYGSATYSLVSHRMQKNGVDFAAAEARYRGKKGIKRQIKNKELIENDPELKKKFAETVAVLLYETGKENHEKKT